MGVKNYYAILGVPANETPAGLRAAYREAARRLHPDVAGAGGTAAFQDINEAYAVLSNPARRRQHDREIEPRRGVPIGTSLFDRPESTHPSFEEFVDRYIRNFGEHYVPKSEHAEGLTLDVVLSPEEAMYGCAIPIGVPVFRACGECGGSGRIWAFPCLDCGGLGYAEETRTLWFRVPPMVRSGAVFEAPLEDYGIGNLYLRLHVSVSGA